MRLTRVYGKSFLGLVNYNAKFLPNLGTVLAPLYQLLRKDVSKVEMGVRAGDSIWRSKAFEIIPATGSLRQCTTTGSSL